jgi:hypothetical protein
MLDHSIRDLSPLPYYMSFMVGLARRGRLKFWDDAFLVAVYLINRTPSRVLNYEIPLECLFQQKLDYTCLNVFGYACWPNLHPYNTHKLQFRSKMCAFLGYSILHKGFK